ncbi:SDR family oxidoreductase [Kordiimonas pumila]|uniref:SDR family oxidoreductase n=1 Tax=Kordiimonas pumila TaxID=2161677 RepID=A0ABV7D7T4_9PROT|nr:SDR family oxidoreductase [Kordiimonas pumila]
MIPHTFKTALVTGAAKRIGRAIAKSLASEGITVAVHHNSSAADAADVVSDICASGGKAFTVSADLNNEAELNALIPEVCKRAGSPVDVLVNNASLFLKDDISTLTTETWDAHQRINLRAPVILTQAFSQQLPAPHAGLVVNIIDQRVLKLNPLFMSYTASKSGLWTMTRTLAQALAKNNIRVNAISPGPTLPNTVEGHKGFEQECKNVPLGYGPDIREFTAAIRFLLETPSLTGQMITLDGGQHLAWRTDDIVED